jgi:hypothetical protein
LRTSLMIACGRAGTVTLGVRKEGAGFMPGSCIKGFPVA